MILGETVSITFMGGVLGVGLGLACLELVHQASTQIIPFGVNEMLGAWLVYLLAAAAGIGLASGIVPAIRAAQLSVVDGLRRVV
jgi:ABC-type antimicrobial peptide transport system permease subunit